MSASPGVARIVAPQGGPRAVALAFEGWDTYMPGVGERATLPGAFASFRGRLAADLEGHGGEGGC